MERSVLIAGATGLTGSEFLKISASENKLDKIVVLTRREIPSIKDNPLFEQNKINFDRLSDYKSIINAEIIVCSIGTTIKKAGSEEEFRRVDYEIPYKLARFASENNSSYFILVSSVGADESSRNFYLKVKGELERDIKKLNFRGIHILHPSLLIGDRKEKRAGEKIGQKLSKLFSPLIPAKYRPVDVNLVGKKIHDICVNPSDGVHVYEGKDFYGEVFNTLYLGSLFY
jgi:uncharacterized protein YbjT (DUF2867 family)